MPREVFVVFDPEVLTGELLAGKTAVVIDVLRATSSMLAALAAGATRVVPTLRVAEAVEMKQRLGPAPVVLGGERDGLQIQGFDVGNTPQEFTPERVRGKTVIITTTNGTRALLMALPADRVYVAALNNVGATARALAEGSSGDVVLIGSGTERRVSWEDTFCAGAVVERLLDLDPEGTWHVTDSALIALRIWQAVSQDVPGALRRGRGGRNVIARGLNEAFEACQVLDSVDFAARVNNNPLEIFRDEP